MKPTDEYATVHWNFLAEWKTVHEKGAKVKPQAYDMLFICVLSAYYAEFCEKCLVYFILHA